MNQPRWLAANRSKSPVVRTTIATVVLLNFLILSFQACAGETTQETSVEVARITQQQEGEDGLKQIHFVTSSDNPNNLLGLCEGDCDHDEHCDFGLYCFQRNANEDVPGCSGGIEDDSRTDYCAPMIESAGRFPQQPSQLTRIVNFGRHPPRHRFPLGICQGDCDFDWHCADKLICFHGRNRFQSPPGCRGNDVTRTNYCIDPAFICGALTSYGSNPPDDKFPLGMCEGGCDNDSHCRGSLICYKRGRMIDPVPGCLGRRQLRRSGYCIKPTGYCPRLYNFGRHPAPSKIPLSLCEGDCDEDWQCEGRLVCYHRERGDRRVPGCRGRGVGSIDYCVNPNALSSDDDDDDDDVSELPQITIVNTSNVPPEMLGLCEGDCDEDAHCQDGLYCFQRDEYEEIPGCSGGFNDGSVTDYCVMIEELPELDFVTSSSSADNLGLCEGDCDTDRDCNDGLYCFHRNAYDIVPGCLGGLVEDSENDYCVSLSTFPYIRFVTDSPSDDNLLGLCQGDCDNDEDCEYGFYCFQRDGNETILGCNGGEMEATGIDYCAPYNTLPYVRIATRSDNPDFDLGLCEGDCDDDDDCSEGLYCYQREGYEFVPGCSGGEKDGSATDYCVPLSPIPYVHEVTTSSSPTNLGVCEGDCDEDEHCAAGLYCFQREPFDAVPSCAGGEADASASDYCVPLNAEEELPTVRIVSLSNDPNPPLGLCEGDCDDDSDCQDGLYCFQRDEFEPVVGCSGGLLDSSRSDFCAPLLLSSMDYIPGQLNTKKLGLLLSQGLDARLIATSGEFVEYANGTLSEIPFHSRPDAGATFEDHRPHNPGGWIYVSNSEMLEEGAGGVGAITFDAQGSVIEYKRVLDNTTINCGGGKTPWGAWISCEENGRKGHVYQVDPTGERPSQKIILGDEGGQWESFAYDDRNASQPHFFVTEDHWRGTLARYTPNNPDWTKPWEILLDTNGTKDYLVLNFDGPNFGTFNWTTSKYEARRNAEYNYPEQEGIDRRGSELFFVCKRIRMMYTLQLDEGTFRRTSTVAGLFEGQPDQLQRILEFPSDLLYFTEEGGKNAGIHARDETAQFFTIMEGPEYPGETTGLAFSPDGKFMYVAYQEVGTLFCIWRRDGKSFGAELVDIKYHETPPLVDA